MRECPHRVAAWTGRGTTGCGRRGQRGDRVRERVAAADLRPGGGPLHGSVTDLVVLDEARFFDSLQGDALMAAALPTQATQGWSGVDHVDGGRPRLDVPAPPGRDRPGRVEVTAGAVASGGVGHRSRRPRRRSARRGVGGSSGCRSAGRSRAGRSGGGGGADAGVAVRARVREPVAHRSRRAGSCRHRTGRRAFRRTHCRRAGRCSPRTCHRTGRSRRSWRAWTG